MTLPAMRLRQKLLALLLFVGGVGITALALVLLLTDRQLFDHFLPENRALRDIDARSKLLVQNYYRYMLTPDLVSVDEVENTILLMRDRVDEYRRLVSGQPRKLEIVQPIADAIEALEGAGQDLIIARMRFNQINELQKILEEEIERVFTRYQREVSGDISRSIVSADWNLLTGNYLPELRMIKTLHLLYLQLFLEIREFQVGAEIGGDAEIDRRIGSIKRSATLLEVIEANSGKRSWMATNVLVIYDKMLDVVTQFRESKRTAEFALSRAEQYGLDLNQAVETVMADSETIGWNELRRSLLLSGAILLATLLISYTLIYAGLDRILRPLEKLQVVITRLGQGDFKQRSVDVMRTDEIGQLANAFNRMAEQLEENVVQKQQFIDQLEQKNVELERFTYTVSHELKSPLVTVSGFVGLLERDLVDENRERISDDMGKISEAVSVMSKQLDDLLELSRIGRQVSEPDNCALTELCTEVVRVMQGVIRERDAVVEIERDMPQVLADAARIREVFQNLIENGIKFTPSERRPRIEIKAEESDGLVVCRITDNGTGIEPRYQERVFGLFDRLDTGVPGTGIGLALVKRIIETHAGDIWIESQGDGQGCCFCFTLPSYRRN